MAADRDWAAAYALQALSDLQARELLVNDADRCHSLHYLQMAAEKVCKAYLVRQNGEETLRRIHSYVKPVLPLIARQTATLIPGAHLRSWQHKAIKAFAREIEVLAPSCDEGDTRRDNSEYPWLDHTGAVQTPCLYAFPGLNERDRTMILSSICSERLQRTMQSISM